MHKQRRKVFFRLHDVRKKILNQYCDYLNNLNNFILFTTMISDMLPASDSGIETLEILISSPSQPCMVHFLYSTVVEKISTRTIPGTESLSASLKMIMNLILIKVYYYMIMEPPKRKQFSVSMGLRVLLASKTENCTWFSLNDNKASFFFGRICVSRSSQRKEFVSMPVV